MTILQLEEGCLLIKLFAAELLATARPNPRLPVGMTSTLCVQTSEQTSDIVVELSWVSDETITPVPEDGCVSSPAPLMAPTLRSKRLAPTSPTSELLAALLQVPSVKAVRSCSVSVSLCTMNVTPLRRAAEGHCAARSCHAEPAGWPPEEAAPGISRNRVRCQTAEAEHPVSDRKCRAAKPGTAQSAAGQEAPAPGHQARNCYGGTS